MLGAITIPLFPLSTVLFRGGYLPLNIFEPRYLRMIADCQKADIGFGVVLIKEGEEVHSGKGKNPPDIYSIGTLADILKVEKVGDDRLAVIAVGGAKFRIDSTWLEENQLMMGEVTFIPDEPTGPVRDQDADLVDLLEYFIQAQNIPVGRDRESTLNDERELSLRLADYLPIRDEDKQKLLQMDSPRVRLTTIRQWSDL